MIKILFVCHGNICRSPMAEFVLKDMVSKLGKAEEFEISSAATSSEEVGNPVYPPVKKILSSHNIDSSGKRARRIAKSDYGKFDYIIGMDEENMWNLKRFFAPDSEKKIYKLLSFAGSDEDVADPWYTGGFQQTWQDINIGCKALLRTIESSYGADQT